MRLPRLYVLPLAVLTLTGCEKAHQMAMLASARSLYYDARKSGFQGYACDVLPDWNRFLSTATRQAEQDTPWTRYLSQAHLSFTQPVGGDVTVTWIDPATPPPGYEQRAATMQRAFHDMVEGFERAVLPALTDTWLPSLPVYDMQAVDSGYQLKEDDAQGRHTVLTLDGKFLLRHLSMHSSRMHVESDLTFQPSPRGLLMSEMNTQSQEPPEAPAVRSRIVITYADLNGIFLPSSFVNILPSGTQIPFRFQNCRLTH